MRRHRPPPAGGSPGPDPTQEPPTPEERQALREADIQARLADLKRTATWLELAAQLQARRLRPTRHDEDTRHA